MRGRRLRRRSVGLWLILGGVVLVSIAVFALAALETTVVGAGTFLHCGSALVPTAGGDAACGRALLELWLCGAALALAGALALTCGVVLRTLTPRPLGF